MLQIIYFSFVIELGRIVCFVGCGFKRVWRYKSFLFIGVELLSSPSFPNSIVSEQRDGSTIMAELNVASNAFAGISLNIYGHTKFRDGISSSSIEWKPMTMF